MGLSSELAPNAGTADLAASHSARCGACLGNNSNLPRLVHMAAAIHGWHRLLVKTAGNKAFAQFPFAGFMRMASMSHCRSSTQVIFSYVVA